MHVLYDPQIVKAPKLQHQPRLGDPPQYRRPNVEHFFGDFGRIVEAAERHVLCLHAGSDDTGGA